MRHLKTRLTLISALLLIVTCCSSGCTIGASTSSKTLDVSMYDYQDTKNLIKFVHNASLIVKNEGFDSIEYFKKNRKLYNRPNYYLYIYKANGINLFHADMISIEGHNLSTLTDKDGKPVMRLIHEAIYDESNVHSWVHYSWWEQYEFYPVPKSSCHFLVQDKEGELYFVGGGMNYPHEEKEFVRIIVDNAAEILELEGADAITILEDPIKQFNFRDVRVFVFDESGKMIVEPVNNAEFQRGSVLHCVDDVGFKPFLAAKNSLKTKNKVWKIFMTKSRYDRKLVKKCMYVRKASMNSQTVYVGAITDLPHPSF
ncbi:MAG: cache domain-containing protein [Caldisericia bacterium]|nr:cache domain-containing protein [Caldisericia bacterium]